VRCASWGCAVSRVLVDTSAWIESLRERGPVAVRDEVWDTVRQGDAVLCDVVRLELWHGARGQAEQRRIQQLEDTVDRVDIGQPVWDLAVDLARQARAGGLTVPVADLLVVACARHHGLALLHRDAHLDRLLEVLGRS
jgi:predicted nucleic acid-binding protein